ncbi:hypothetical protein D1872_343300 [compost metagenome]
MDLEGLVEAPADLDLVVLEDLDQAVLVVLQRHRFSLAVVVADRKACRLLPRRRLRLLPSSLFRRSR